jgi:hypothetical protein
MNPSNAVSPNDLNTLLDRMQYRADPLADDTISRILGAWNLAPMAASNPTALAQPQWQKLAAITQTFTQWQDNRSINDWRPNAGIASEIGAPLQIYTGASRQLPEWADHKKIERAEALFMDYGVLSVTMLFCSSLPECYVIPDLADVLHTTGQLEKHTTYRIRSTGAMIFPVMMKGGLTAPGGGGVAQVFKVRLIHATIRNLILRGSAEEAMATLGTSANNHYAADVGVVPPLKAFGEADNMYHTLFAHGWQTGALGLPCNQEELAYTLLTFSYVFLRSMRKLGLALSSRDEEAYLHAWNVAGHVLGIERGLMADTMEQAEAMFTRMQTRGRADRASRPESIDPRPALGNALMQSMASVIPLSMAKFFPVLLTRYLCGTSTSQDLGLNASIPWLPRALFAGGLFFTRVVDTLVRVVFPEFSIARFFTRVLGYHLITKLMMDQTRPLKLPQHIQERIGTMMAQWGNDAKAPGWMNAFEDYLTTKGSWKVS